MKTISKSKLKAGMLRIFRELEQTGEELIVTDHGQAVLKIKPIKNVNEIFADVQGQIVYHEDILSPTAEEWGALE